MSVRYDEKGKYFTDVITKDAVPCILQTLMHRIRGFVHVRIGERLIDEIGQSRQFLAVTQARVFSLQGQELYHSDFVIVNRDHLVWIIPEEDLDYPQEEPEGEA
jgi:hypothetical protein